MEVFLDYCMSYCCMCCSCFCPRDFDDDLYEPLLLEEERTAVNELLNYLNREYEEKPVLSKDRQHALSILTYSHNEDLQRSAALCLAELSERLQQPIPMELMEPLIVLLESRDIETQKAASLAISNLTLYGPDSNKVTIMQSGAIHVLIRLLKSPSREIQCNACGCITTLATTDVNKREIVRCGGIPSLIKLARSQDLSVKRNAAGALLNLTHVESNRSALVSAGAVQLFIDLLDTNDTDVQYYCAAAISNMAVDETHRATVVKEGNHKVLTVLIRLLQSPSDKVKCQACFALRNLASDEPNQVAIVEMGALPYLQNIMQASEDETMAAAIAALRNLSIHKANEKLIIEKGFLVDLNRILHEPLLWDAHCHAAGTVRNLAAGSQANVIVEQGVLDSLIFVFLQTTSPVSVQAEITAAMAVMGSNESARKRLTNGGTGKILSRLVSLAVNSTHSEVQYNSAGTIGQMLSADLTSHLISTNQSGIMTYLQQFLESVDPAFVHIALWTIMQLLNDPGFHAAFDSSELPHRIEDILKSSLPSQIKHLARTVLAK
ncbi:uncharacterized protein [Amphiura filiformis]|uniref:uncharacterized protein isoform X2 n=1 Tax=Amphiura filiformis TaxID=82378 RepID=UPI003B21D45E